MLAWGPMEGYTGGRYTIRQAMEKCAARGYEWTVLIIDDPRWREYNSSIWAEYVAESHRVGMLAGAWVTDGGSLYLTPGDADLAIAELEGPFGGPGDYEGIMNVLAAGQLPSCPVAICTNFSNATRSTAHPLIAAGFACLTESYLNENPNVTPDNMDRIARELGWPTSQPVFGVYPVGGVPPPSYAQWQTWPGVDYLVEYVI